MKSQKNLCLDMEKSPPIRVCPKNQQTPVYSRVNKECKKKIFHNQKSEKKLFFPEKNLIN